MKLKKEEYHQMLNLYVKQNWLIAKKEELTDLIKFCKTSNNKKLIFSLLERFNYLNHESFSIILNDICDFIINESGFSEKTTQLLALAYDDEADSSQKILDNIKLPIFKKGWKNIATVNKFGKAIKHHKAGRTQIVTIDEFIGSGKTLLGRIDYLKKNINEDFELICCFIAGIKESVLKIQEEGVHIFCPLLLDKGMSGYFQAAELSKAKRAMKNLEKQLAPKINTKELKEYSLGYGSAEALFTLEGCNGNTPNSVFPIFWWTQDKKNNIINTLLTRFEIGF